MDNLLEFKSIWTIIGGIASLFLTVGIKYSLRLKKYDQEFKSINRNIQYIPKLKQHYGDVSTWLDNRDDFKKYRFFSELFRHSIQPLIILSILSLVDYFDEVLILFVIGVLIFSFIHEIVWAEKMKEVGWYRLILSVWWIVFFIMIMCLELTVNGEVPTN